MNANNVSKIKIKLEQRGNLTAGAEGESEKSYLKAGRLWRAVTHWRDVWALKIENLFRLKKDIYLTNSCICQKSPPEKF